MGRRGRRSDLGYTSGGRLRQPSGARAIVPLSGAAYALQAARGGAGGAALRQPRIGLYRPWNANADEGWTRSLLETHGIEHTSLYNAVIRAGELGSRYDVIVLADLGSRQILDGFVKGSVPRRYEGGIGAEGVRELDAFVGGGGTLVTINSRASSPSISFIFRSRMSWPTLSAPSTSPGARCSIQARSLRRHRTAENSGQRRRSPKRKARRGGEGSAEGGRG